MRSEMYFYCTACAYGTTSEDKSNEHVDTNDSTHVMIGKFING